jgi:hypothetical protein
MQKLHNSDLLGAKITKTQFIGCKNYITQIYWMQKLHTVNAPIECHGDLFFDSKILEIFTLVPTYVILLKGWQSIRDGVLLEHLR